MSLPPPSFRSRFVPVAGARVYVQEWGGHGPALLCVHGLGGGAHFFSALGPSLADVCRTVAVDLPGCGLSPATASPSFEGAASLLLELVHQERLGPLTVLGHSMGAIVALEMIRLARTEIQNAVLAGGLPEARPAARDRLRDRIARVRREGLAGLGEPLVAANFSQRTRAERPELTGLFVRAFELQSPATYLDWIEALCDWAAKPLPALGDVRVLAITGDEDLYAPPADVEAFVAALRAQQEGSDGRGSKRGGFSPASPDESHIRFKVLRECGHLPFLEQPAAFAALVREFVG